MAVVANLHDRTSARERGPGRPVLCQARGCGRATGKRQAAASDCQYQEGHGNRETCPCDCGMLSAMNSTRELKYIRGRLDPATGFFPSTEVPMHAYSRTLVADAASRMIRDAATVRDYHSPAPEFSIGNLMRSMAQRE